MEARPIVKLLKNYELLPESDNIPYFEDVRPLLYNLFAAENSLTSMLFSDYYMKNRNKTEQILYDPADQINWCAANSAIVGSIAKSSSKMRNILVYRKFLSVTTIADTIKAFIDFYYKLAIVPNIVEIIIDQLYLVSEKILGKEQSATICCPLCKSRVVLDMMNNDLFFIEEDVIKKSSCDEFTTIGEWKANGYKEKLKGSKILILDGKYVGHEATFKNWSGTVCNVDIQFLGMKTLRMDCSIRII